MTEQKKEEFVEIYPLVQMSLRDWFAGMALPGLTKLVEGGRDGSKKLLINRYEIASFAYLIADAMLEERKK